jgi:hypothetical protein
MAMRKQDARNLRRGDMVAYPLGSALLPATVIGITFEENGVVVIPIKVPGLYDDVEVTHREIFPVEKV